MAQSKVDKIETQIKTAGFNWVPGETPIGSLSKVKQDSRLGLKVKESELQRVEKLIAESIKGPRKLVYANRCDWRVKKGENWITPVKDQGGCGSCVAFASVATIETQTRIQIEQHTAELDLSESDLYFCGGRSCSEGWWPTDALDYVLNNGVSEEACFPYNDHDMDCSTCSDRDQRFLKIGKWREIIPIDARKEWLDKNGPLMACMAVYRDFFNYKDGVYHPVSTDLAGYHAVTCIGYSEEEQCWICKNSWSKDWGNQGFFKIGYGAAEMDTRFAMYGVADVTGPLLDKFVDGGKETVCSWAEYTVTEDELDSGTKILWAYVDNNWRYKTLSSNELLTLSNIIESSNSIQVCYKGEEIQRIYGWHHYEAKQVAKTETQMA